MHARDLSPGADQRRRNDEREDAALRLRERARFQREGAFTTEHTIDSDMHKPRVDDCKCRPLRQHQRDSCKRRTSKRIRFGHAPIHRSQRPNERTCDQRIQARSHAFETKH